MVSLLRKAVLIASLMPIGALVGFFQAAPGSLPIAFGGTGASTAAGALSNLLGNPAAGTYVVTCTTSSSCAPTAGGGGSLPSSTKVIGTNGVGAAIAATASDVASLFGCSVGSPFLTYSGGCSSSTAATQRGKNATSDGTMSTSLSDNSSALLSLLSTFCASTACEIYIPCGVYKFTNTPKVPVTSGTYTGVKIIGEGRGAFQGKTCVEFDQYTPGDGCLWWDNTTVGSGNNGGPDIENITCVDKTPATGTNSCASVYGTNATANHPGWVNSGGCMGFGFRFTQTNYGILRGLSVQNSPGLLDWNGALDGAGTQSITVTNGSQTATCSPSCSFPSWAPTGHLWVQGKNQEILSASGNTLTLTSKWTYPSYTGTNWNIDSLGVSYMWDDLLSGCTSSSDCFAQYWNVEDVYSWGTRVGVDFVGDNTSACWAGESRFRFYGNAFRGEHIPDGIGLFIGKCVDTVEYNLSQNDYAFQWEIENGHANKILGLGENSPPDANHAAIYTCNSGTPLKSCTRGLVVNCEATGECQDNSVDGAYIYFTGNPIEWNDNNAGISFQGEYVFATRMEGNTTNLPVWLSGTSCTSQTSVTVYTHGCQKGN